jgi:hypothetical protein
MLSSLGWIEGVGSFTFVFNLFHHLEVLSENKMLPCKEFLVVLKVDCQSTNFMRTYHGFFFFFNFCIIIQKG